MKTSAGPVPSQVLSAELWFRDGLSAGGGGWALRSTALGGGGAYKRWDLQLAVAFVLTSDCGSSHGTRLMPMRICEQRESLVPSILFDFLSLTQAFTVAPSAMRPSSVTKLMVVTQPGTSSLKAARERSPSLCTLPGLGHLLMTIGNGPTVNNMDVQISRKDTLAILDINSPHRVTTFLSEPTEHG